MRYGGDGVLGSTVVTYGVLGGFVVVTGSCFWCFNGGFMVVIGRKWWFTGWVSGVVTWFVVVVRVWFRRYHGRNYGLRADVKSLGGLELIKGVQVLFR